MQVRFRPLSDDDMDNLVRWMNAEHAQPWFKDVPRTVAGARQQYANVLDGTSQTRMWIVMLDGQDVGYTQDYPVAAYDDYAVRVQDLEAIAFDYLIGEPEAVGQGVGTEMIRAYCRYILCRDYPAAPRFIASPDARNKRSLRVLEKCGFNQGLWIQPEAVEYPEIVCSVPRYLFED